MTVQKGIMWAMKLAFALTIIINLVTKQLDQEIFLLYGLLLCFVPDLVMKLFRIHIPDNGQLVTCIFIFGAQYLGSFLHFYTLFPWWDAMLHFSSGFLMAYWGLVLITIVDRQMILYKQKKIIMIAIISLLVGISSAGVWEIIEFLGDCILGTNAQLGSLRDTMEDIICGTIGGGLFSLYVGWQLKRAKQGLVEHLFRSNIPEE